MIKSILIKGFKSIDMLDVTCNYLNIITGTNSSGKSTFLQALLLMAQNATGNIGLNGELIKIGDFSDAKNFNTVSKKIEFALASENISDYNLIFEKDEFSKSHARVNSYVRETKASELIGVPCSGGIAEGEALVIKDPKDTLDVEGKILITKMTDPGWVFLLTSAKGVISEKGSLLSHTAIISRELGVPSIVGVKDLTEIIHTGDQIRMNGDNGKIEIIRRGAADEAYKV